MYLRSLSGKILFEGRFATLKKCVEAAVEYKANLQGVNLRQANLNGAAIDGAQMPQACLWGANLSGADMSEGDYSGADFRAANFVDTALGDSNLSDADLSGAYFSKTILTQTCLRATRFSCPSIFTLNLVDAATLQGSIYSHQGEIECDLSHAPLVIRGLQRPIICMDDAVLVGTTLKKIEMREDIMRALLTSPRLEKLLAA